MKVYLSPIARDKLTNISNYLLDEWGSKVQNDFLEKLRSKIELIQLEPEISPKSHLIQGLYKCVLSKQITFYYRVNFELSEVEIITFFDTRQDPKKLKEDM